MNYDDSILEFIFLQQVNIFESGERIKMSKRAGKIVTMDDLISVVGKDAALFFIARKANAILILIWAWHLQKNNENPVYYCQYAHARICSIIKKARSEKIYPKHFKKEMVKKLIKPEELALIQKMADLPELLILIAVHREPHRLTTYIEELASLLHHYYEKYQIVNVKNPALSQARLMLLYTVRKVMQICFELMGISAPETM